MRGGKKQERAQETENEEDGREDFSRSKTENTALLLDIIETCVHLEGSVLLALNDFKA